MLPRNHKRFNESFRDGRMCRRLEIRITRRWRS